MAMTPGATEADAAVEVTGRPTPETWKPVRTASESEDFAAIRNRAEHLCRTRGYGALMPKGPTRRIAPMTYKLIAAATFSLGLCTAIAMAQTDTTMPDTGAAPDTAAGSQLPSGWDGAIGDAFFADSELGTLRSEDEVRANWETLTDEQQAQVRSHCATVDMAAADTTNDAAGGTTGDTTAGDTTTGADDDVTTSSTSPEGAMHTASIEQVCGWVDAM